MPVYDVFISYKSEDRAWAERLDRELTDAGLKVYWDKMLIAGRDWLPQLEAALRGSGALVSIWSERAAAKIAFNDREEFTFGRPEFVSSVQGGRPVIRLRLDDTPSIWPEVHAINGLKGFKHPDAVPQATWKVVAQNIKRAARPSGVIYVETLILAATDAEMAAPKGEAASRDFDMLVETLDLRASLPTRYGKDRWDWSPYGLKTVREMLMDLERKAEDHAKLKLGFVPADETVWSPDREKSAAAARELAGKLSLVVVDPLSMFVYPVHSCLGRLGQAEESPTVAFAVLYPLPADDEPLRFVVETFIRSLYQTSLKPSVPPNLKAPVGMHVRTADELLRVMLLAHARDAETAMPARGNVMTTMAGA